MSEKEARLKIAQLVGAEFKRKNIDPTIFAEENLNTYEKAGLECLLAAEESRSSNTTSTPPYHPLMVPYEVGKSLIEMTIPEQPRSSALGYRLTAKGRSLLKAQDLK